MTEEAPSRLILVRHGESQSNRGLWISGQATCGGLTERGRAEARVARDRLAQLPEFSPDMVVVSTMRRAIETAEIVAGPTGMVAEQRPGLIERIPGEIEGTTVVDYVDQFGSRPWADWQPALSPGGEDAVTFQNRVGEAITELMEETVGRTTWVVCHGWVIRATAHHFVGGNPAAEPLFGGVANAAFCVWTSPATGAAWELERYNDHAHTNALGAGSGAFT